MTNRGSESVLEKAPLEVVQSAGSTNTELMERPWSAVGDRSWSSLLALEQTAGRGRRGKTWLAQGEGSLCLSIAQEITDIDGRAERNLPGLSLAIGVAVVELLEAQCEQALAHGSLWLKWPNDIVSLKAESVPPVKLGGILIEVKRQAPKLRVVVGLGLNLLSPQLPVIGESPLSLPAGGLFSSENLPDRRALAGALATAMHDTVERCLQEGWASFKTRFEARDVLLGKALNLSGAGPQDGEEVTFAMGVAQDAALLVRSQSKDSLVRAVYAGEVSVRAQDWGMRT